MVSLIKREYDYALRIVSYLGGIYPGHGKTIRELSQSLQISKAITTRITYKLIRKNILKSRQGRYGGMFLQIDPAELTIMDVLHAMDYDSTTNACLREEDICPLVPFCPIRKKFSILEETLHRQLEGIRIKEILLRESKIKTIEKN